MAKSKFSLIFNNYDSTGMGALLSGLCIFFEYKKVWKEIATLSPSQNTWTYQTPENETTSIAQPFLQNGPMVDLTEELHRVLESEFAKLKQLVKDKDIPSGPIPYEIRIARFLFKTAGSVVKTQSGLFLEVQGENIGSSLFENYKVHLKPITLQELESYFSNLELLHAACESALHL